MSGTQTTPLPGFCQCGCGELAPVSKRTRYDIGHVKGMPIKFIRGHNGTTPARSGYKVCTRCLEEKKVSEFGTMLRRDRGTTSLRSKCRDCRRAYDRERNALKPKKYYPRLTSEEKLRANRERVKEWRIKNPHKKRRQAIRDYLRRKGAPLVGDSREYVESILIYDICCYCGEKAGSTMDHIEPLSKGGDSHWSNLSGACLECNSGKGNKDLLAYMLHRKTYGGQRYT